MFLKALFGELNVCILQVKQDSNFPADLLFLASTNPDGVCYIEVLFHVFTQLLYIANLYSTC